MVAKRLLSSSSSYYKLSEATRSNLRCRKIKKISWGSMPPDPPRWVCLCTHYRIAGKFGGLAVYYYNRQIKIRQNFLLAYICMAIPYRTAKFKSANILSIAILGSTAKFNARQYFWLYGMLILSTCPPPPKYLGAKHLRPPPPPPPEQNPEINPD